MTKRKKQQEATPCLLIELFSDSTDAIYTTICKTNDIEFAKNRARLLWKVAENPYLVRVKDGLKVVWEWK